MGILDVDEAQFVMAQFQHPSCRLHCENSYPRRLKQCLSPPCEVPGTDQSIAPPKFSLSHTQGVRGYGSVGDPEQIHLKVFTQHG